MEVAPLFFGPQEHATCCRGLTDITSIKSKKMTFSPHHHMNVRRYHDQSHKVNGKYLILWSATSIIFRIAEKYFCCCSNSI